MKFPSPTDLASFSAAGISPGSLQDNGAQLPRAKSAVAPTNVVFTEQETLCSHIRVKYLLFISAKARERKEQKGKGERKAGREKVRVIKTDRERGK